MSRPNIVDPRSECILHHDLDSLSEDYEEGKQVGESWGVKELDAIYTRMPGFLYVHTGWPNSGKSTINLFMKLVNAIKYNKKYQVWSFEEISHKKVNGNTVINSNNLFDNLVHMYTGKSPYKHWEKKYGIKQMPHDEWFNAHEVVSKYFIFCHIKDKSYKNLLDHVVYVNEECGTDGFVFDPVLKIKMDSTGRSDKDIDYFLEETKEVCVKTNQTGDLIVHPRTDYAPKNIDGSYKRCDHHSLLGGSSWNNNVDCLMSWYRPFAHLESKHPNYPLLTGINYKQRDESLTNRKGEYDGIEFDYFKNRYYFDGVCPIDGEVKRPKPIQPAITFGNTWESRLEEREKEAPF